MPLFEYICADCQHHFEALVTRDRHAVCPKCEGQHLDKQFSVFAVSTGGSSSASQSMPTGSCGSCGDPRGPGSCSIN